MIKPECPVCSENTSIVIATFEQWENISEKYNEHIALRHVCKKSNIELFSKSFYQCANCKLIFLYPSLNNSELSVFYTSYHANDNAIKKIDKKLKRASRRIKGFINKTNGNSFLDVGCNIGVTVEAARRIGLNSTGIEIDSMAIAIAKKQFPECQFINIDVEKFSKEGVQYDLVYCSEVIEHVPDPIVFSRALFNLVKPGGLLFMTTPDAGHLFRPGNFLRWNEVKPPEHLFWHNKKSIKTLLEGAGFSQINFRLNLKPGLKLYAFK